ncbi:LysM peptidoglycan-binding domain-containing protein [Yinghuangia sp. ASG 101]|uniref:LysM peptidoglycan-binding domain-containing protein n=1 Tax=Yinghuangia sp. ASG 101 TaxID=2896848 RepID=UPI001E3E5F36|nr:LysM peptidoglycan-binding domain-containing protein [Yinghuangia sp. ASG 101]UGQ10525.1 LysM peptidoglycan-binding domain-containing protein [Yinghuangia sp. ASG 101]
MTPPGTRPGTAAARTPVRLTPQRGRRGVVRLAHAAWAFLRAAVAAGLLAGAVAGAPYALHRLSPDPWPEHRRSWDEVRDALLAPTTDQVILDVLVAVGWVAWVGFVLSLLAELGWYLRHFPTLVRDASAHRAHQHEAGVLRAPAAWLAGLLIIALVAMMRATHTTVVADGPRMPVRPAAVTAAFAPVEPPPVPMSPPAPLADVRTDGTTRTFAGPASVGYTTYTVQPGDTLWDIAAEQLGDPIRWPQIYTLSRNLAQPDGGRLTDPDVIRPGWILRLPADARPAAPPAVPVLPEPVLPIPPPPAEEPAPAVPPSVPPPGLPPQSEPPPTLGPSATPAPSTAPEEHADAAKEPSEHAFHLSGDAFVGLGLAAAITVAALTVWLRRRREYEPGSGDRGDLSLAPIVRAMRSAHDQVLALDDEGGAEPPAGLVSADPYAAARNRARRTASAAAIDGPSLGIRDGRALAVSIVHRRGLGLTGPGAAAAVRALLIALLADRHRPDGARIRVVIPEADARRLFDGDVPRPHPTHLIVVPELASALIMMESEIDARTGPFASIETGTDLYLVATPLSHLEERLTNVLAAGSRCGLAGVLMGQWGGPVAWVQADGTVATASESVAELSGTRLFSLPADGSRTLLDLLYQAEPTAPPHPRPAQRRQTPPPAGSVRTLNPAPEIGTDTGPDAETEFPGPPQSDESEPDDDEALQAPLLPPPWSDAMDSGWAATDSDVPEEPPAVAPPLSARAGMGTAAEEERDDGAVFDLKVLGPVHLTFTRYGDAVDLTGFLAPKQRELLAYLALHPDGVRRQTLSAALWPTAPTARPSNVFHATLSQMRQAIRGATGNEAHDVTSHRDGRYAVDGELAAVDLWDIWDDLTTLRGAADDEERGAVVERLANRYRGNLAEDMTAEWLDAPREELRRDVLDALSAHARAIIESAPVQALALLERARPLDPYNESLYRSIAHVQARLGLMDHITRTLALLTTALAEIDEQPSEETIALCDELRRRPPQDPGGRLAIG